jgi:hypothetical protein
MKCCFEVSEVLAAFIMRAMMMEAASTSGTSVNFYQTTWSYNPEDSHLYFKRQSVCSTKGPCLCLRKV